MTARFAFALILGIAVAYILISSPVMGAVTLALFVTLLVRIAKRTQFLP